MNVYWTSPFSVKTPRCQILSTLRKCLFMLTEVLSYVFSVSCSKKKCRLQGRHHEVLIRGDGFTCAKPTCPPILISLWISVTLFNKY